MKCKAYLNRMDAAETALSPSLTTTMIGGANTAVTASARVAAPLQLSATFVLARERKIAREHLTRAPPAKE
jgi:hypothetical protein